MVVMVLLAATKIAGPSWFAPLLCDSSAFSAKKLLTAEFAENAAENAKHIAQFRLFLSQGLYGFEHGGASGGIEAGRDPGDSERNHGQCCRGSNQLGRIESLTEIHSGQHSHQSCRASDADASTQQG